jgi:hypothetical protein
VAVSPSRFFRPLLSLSLSVSLSASYAEQKNEFFDTDPGWEGTNNRSTAFDPVEVVQDFGYTPAAEGTPARIGGQITPTGEPAYSGRIIDPLTFEDPFTASGKLVVEEGAGNFLLGFFNSHTLNEWRTPNTLAFRINGRGETFHTHLEYATRLWRAQASVIGRHDIEKDRVYPIENPSGAQIYSWSMKYDPEASDGKGAMSATLNEHEVTWDLLPGHREEGATFNRFGFLNIVKSYDSPGKAWIFDLNVNGEPIDLSEDPNWDGFNNRRTYITTNIRPKFDFGYSPTNFAGGRAAGETGGLIFRGDCRYPEKMACYGDKVENLSLKAPLVASGKVCLRRGVSDSSVLFGFYHSERSMESNPSQDSGLPNSFLGVVIEGPSAEGFNFYPAYRVDGGGESGDRGINPPRIFPDGAFRVWTLRYDPGDPEGPGKIDVTLDGKSVSMDIEQGHKNSGTAFDRFGFVTPWIDGNGQVVYFDDLDYTWKR